ncbi:hypothetical protein FD723_39890 (plasmid) [Nostoc sp. C052]|uniref:hypothetical protein n=1 Tax=Nostoc sp. C052 TaxID=2576902 RepID=UPI0015C3548F|nr:hypothetical protein [Nostoc sp. C052]QLE46375.1 hypothetical protein FD723_39890 [Nostoc sp. C052]
MRKATLSKNPALQNKQSFIVQGMEDLSVNVVTRDNIEISIETADRPDGTKIPIGRTNPGEFTISIDLADRATRIAYEAWAAECIDEPSNGIGIFGGIKETYKRGAILVYHRLYHTSKSEDAPIMYSLEGCFITSKTLPDFQMDGNETSMMEFNISYDDAKNLASDTFPTWYQSGG